MVALPSDGSCKSLERSLRVMRCRPNGIGVLCLLGVAAWLGCSAPALAQEAVSLEQAGLRYYPAQGEVCVTRSSVPQEALALLGADEATVLSAMESDQLYCIILTGQGTQVSLRISDPPPGAAGQPSAQGMDQAELLALLAPQGSGLSASWPEGLPGFALLSPQEQEQGLPLNTLSLSTLYLGKVYSFQTDVFGREPAQADREALFSAARRMILLGAAARDSGEASQSGPLALPPLPALTEQEAQVSYKVGNLPLELSPIPSVVGTTLWEVSGVTAPKASLKYTLNGRTSSRFQADESGAFSFTMKNLEPDAVNELTVTASQGEDVSTASCSLALRWQPSPLALAQASGTVKADHVFLEGITLPGSKVQLLRRTGTDLIPVGEDGRFRYKVLLKKLGENSFTLRTLSPGYRRADVEVSLLRAIGDAQELASLEGSVKTVAYDKLLAKPSAYEGRTVRYQGTVAALANLLGQPLFLLSTAQGETLACLCPDLLDIRLGEEIDLLGTLSGGKESLQTPWLSGEFPSMALLSLIP